MKEEDRIPQHQHEEETVAVLLSHLKQMRRVVPVNYQLKADLKEQLLQRMKELDTTKGSPALTQGGRKRKWFIRLGIGVLALALCSFGYSWWQKNSLSISERILLTLPEKTSIEQVDMDMSGATIAYVANQSEIRMISVHDDPAPLTVKLPPTSGNYHALAWGHQGKQLAVVEEAGQQSRLWLVDVPDSERRGSSRLLKEEEGVRYDSPSWSPNDETVAYTRFKAGVEEIWVSSTVSFQEWKLAEGSQPDWSPDGRFLAFVKAGSVHVMEMRTGTVTQLGQGKWPSWSSDDQLTYTSITGKLVEVTLHGQVPVSRDLTIHTPSEAKLVRASWSEDGKQVLLAHRLEQENKLVISQASR